MDHAFATTAMTKVNMTTWHKV